jgi:hypothetical protein
MIYLLGFAVLSFIVVAWAAWDLAYSPLGHPDERE